MIKLIDLIRERDFRNPDDRNSPSKYDRFEIARDTMHRLATELSEQQEWVEVGYEEVKNLSIDPSMPRGIYYEFISKPDNNDPIVIDFKFWIDSKKSATEDIIFKIRAGILRDGKLSKENFISLTSMPVTKKVQCPPSYNAMTEDWYAKAVREQIENAMIWAREHAEKKLPEYKAKVAAISTTQPKQLPPTT